MSIPDIPDIPDMRLVDYIGALSKKTDERSIVKCMVLKEIINVIRPLTPCHSRNKLITLRYWGLEPKWIGDKRYTYRGLGAIFGLQGSSISHIIRLFRKSIKHPNKHRILIAAGWDERFFGYGANDITF